MLVVRENFWIQKSFRLISASLKQFSRNITNDILVKQNIFDVMKFLPNSEFQKILLKKATVETSWEIIVITTSISLNLYFILDICIATAKLLGP